MLTSMSIVFKCSHALRRIPLAMSQARAAKPPERGGDALTAAAPESGRRAQTRQALMDAAETLFAERGYHETSVSDIVRAAGVSQGTFYQYFGHRRDVLMA